MVRAAACLLPLAWCCAVAPLAAEVGRSAAVLWPGGARDVALAQAWQRAGAGDAAGARSLLAGVAESEEKGLLARLLAGDDTLPAAELRFAPRAARTLLRTARNGVPIVDATINGVAVELGVDTGAGLSVITESTARRVAARSLDGPRPKVLDSLGEGVEARLAIVDLALPGVEFRGLPVLVMRDENLSARVLGVTLFAFDGLLGWNALGLARVELDFDRGEMTLRPTRAPCDGRNLWSVGSKPLVEAAVDGVPTLALVDTGARRSWLVAAGGAGAEAAPENSRLVAGASGARVVGVRTREDVRVAAAGRILAMRTLDERPARDRVPLQRATLGMDFVGRGAAVLDRGCGEFALSPAQP
ncbi:MAG: retroviral-like aspartic protease family protein [Betaproteobacteria bacterium]|jgi:predicted aspartyl protease|nr:retroviral-like aspartic protease family protein [Betaproteobacteria bacterium]